MLAAPTCGGFMRTFHVLAIAAFAVAAAAEPASVKSYAELVAQAESGDAATDYTALRMAYAASDDYDPYGTATGEKFNSIWPAFQAKDCAKVLPLADEMLKADFTLVSVHVLRSDCLRTNGDGARADREEAIARGLMASLKASGDGKSPKTAFVVVTMSEERFLLVGLGLHEEKQSLISDGGHVYDLIEGSNEKPDGPSSAFFNVDALFAGMARQFQKPGAAAP